MTLRAGIVTDRPPGPKYLAALSFAQLSFGSPLPRPATLRRWRAQLPEDFKVALGVPPEAWASRSVDWLGAAAEALSADVLVLNTDAKLTTSTTSRDKLGAFVGAVRAVSPVPIAWQPSGLWESEDTTKQARKLDLWAVVDPLNDSIAQGVPCYASLNAIGGRRSFSQAALQTVADNLVDSGCDTGYVAIASPGSFREATLLQTLLEA